MSDILIRRIAIFMIVFSFVLAVLLTAKELLLTNLRHSLPTAFSGGAYIISDTGQFQHLIQEASSASTRQQVETVIVLATNTSDIGKGEFVVNDLPWETSAGLLPALEVKHPHHLSVAEHQAVFLQNPTLSKLAGGIKRAFPHAKLLAIMQDNSIPETDSLRFGSELAQYFPPENTVLIACADWADGLSPEVQAFQLTTTRQVMRHHDASRVGRLNTASPAVLRTALQLTGLWGYDDFKATQDSPLASHAVNGYFVVNDEADTTRTSKTTALFFGDVMLDRFMRLTINQHGFDYLLGERMKRFMHGTDVTMVNFEGAMTRFHPYPASNGMMSFTSDPANAPQLAAYGVNMATLANNHSLNFGKEGFQQTRQYLGEAGINTFGTPFNTPEEGVIATVQAVRGIRMAYIGYHELYNPDLSPILAKIAELKDKADFITVVSHWGVEYSTRLPAYQQQSAHKLIDAGADLVIGHHPHVVQPMEVYRGKMIFYSLGNFLFDQRGQESVRTRLAVGITYECTKPVATEVGCADSHIKANLFPMLSNSQYQVTLMDEAATDQFQQQFMAASQVAEQYALNP